jgi:hypothetical protein
MIILPLPTSPGTLKTLLQAVILGADFQLDLAVHANLLKLDHFKVIYSIFLKRSITLKYAADIVRAAARENHNKQSNDDQSNLTHLNSFVVLPNDDHDCPNNPVIHSLHSP